MYSLCSTTNTDACEKLGPSIWGFAGSAKDSMQKVADGIKIYRDSNTSSANLALQNAVNALVTQLQEIVVDCSQGVAKLVDVGFPECSFIKSL